MQTSSALVCFHEFFSCQTQRISDPLGPQAERPKTAARRRDVEDEFADEELGDDLLPE